MSTEVGPLYNRNPINLGKQVTIGPNEIKEVLYLPKNPEGVPTVLDVILDIRIAVNNNETEAENNDTLQFLQPYVRALISWGTGSDGQFNAEVDFVLGTQISIPANVIRVNAKYLIFKNKNIGTVNPEIYFKLPKFKVTAGVGYGASGRSATLTEIVQLNDIGESIELQIPQYTTSFSVEVVGSSSANVKMYGFAKNLATEFTFVGGDFPKHVHLFNGARFLEISNANVDNTPLFAFVVYNLAL